MELEGRGSRERPRSPSSLRPGNWGDILKGIWAGILVEGLARLADRPPPEQLRAVVGRIAADARLRLPTQPNDGCPSATHFRFPGSAGSAQNESTPNRQLQPTATKAASENPDSRGACVHGTGEETLHGAPRAVLHCRRSGGPSSSNESTRHESCNDEECP